tara:strand:- start:37682 stop:38329 length:648 start_codon:yes stop_codon:yes gene_type:complete
MLYLDFDGVIADSSIECLKISEIQNSTRLSPDQRLIFLDNRYLVNEPFGFTLLLSLVIKKQFSAEEYKSLYMSTSTADQVKTNNEFFACRSKYIKSNGIENWVNLNPPTNFFELIKNRGKETIIVSTKDDEALSIWCKKNNFNVCEIHGNQSYRYYGSKYDLIATYGHDRSKIFIDDNQEHLINCDWHAINCKAITAGWGYNDLTDNLDEVIKYL